jgi:predicted murein hydrolase (TIGR00659 family)
MNHNTGLWVYLATSPLLWLTATLLVWLAANRITRSFEFHPLANPVLVAVITLVLVLHFAGVPYSTYFAGAQFIHFLLGLATVALAVPLVRQFELVTKNVIPMFAALIVGSVTAVISVIISGKALGLPPLVIISMAPKSSTAGVAMAISSGLGGDPALTAAVVICTGIFGAIIVTPFMNAMGIKDYAARGFAVGLASHGIGTARAYTVDPVAGLFAGIAMALNAVVTSLVVPMFL